MISLVLPYWQRQQATDRALTLMAAQYFDLDLEVIVVDDGSPEKFKLNKSLPFSIRALYLPKKTNPLSACVPNNRGVEIAKGEYIALSNPETLHNVPVLEAMRLECERGGPKAYVMAAAWCPEQQRWHCHSSMKRGDDNDVGSYLPAGANYHFMTMLHRSLWDEIGGFDEEYRQGAAYEDADFCMKLGKAGAKFIMRDDLVVEHVRTGARADWTPEMFARNRALFMRKWGTKEAQS